MNRWLVPIVLVMIFVITGCGGGGGSKSSVPPAGSDLVITPSNLPVGMPGVLYSQTLSTTGGTEPYAWAIESGTLPGDMALDPATGELSGTPPVPGTFSFKVTVEDSDDPTLKGFRNYQLKITDGRTGWDRAAVDAVLTEGTSGQWDEGAVGMPCVIMEGPADYKMWYSGADAVPQSYEELLAADVAIGLATSADGLTWNKHAGNPVLTKTGSAADPDGAFVGAACVLKKDATYHMFYTGAKSESFMTYDYLVPNICCATSADGITWTRQGAVIEGLVDIQLVTPIPPTISIDAALYYSPWVIYDSGDSLYKMYFTTMSFSAQVSDPSELAGLEDSAATAIGYATSPDGSTWTVQSTTTLTNGAAWESGGVAACSVIQDAQESCYKMFYTGTAGDGMTAIGFASSTNGTSWSKNAGNPIFSPSSSGWDSGSVSSPCVIKDISVPCYRMWYTGSDASGGMLGQIGYAECP